ncbi:MAG TPA: hypothetical protein VIK74_05160 [Parasegetibacter sp.]
MEKIGYIEIQISGSKGNLSLTPENYDIRELIGILENVEDLLYSGDSRGRPLISYRVEEGSVRHIFRTSIQYIIGFNAILGQIQQINNIDFLDIRTAKALENIQDTAKKKNYSFTLRTSLPNTSEVKIDKATNLYRTETAWVNAEFYFYGKLTNAGGKDKANIHITSEDFGTLRIQTPISFLEQRDENLLYRTFGVRVTGKQHSETGEIDPTSLRFVELLDYNPRYDAEYLKGLRDKARKNWLGKIDPNSWLKEIRGDYEA